MARKILKIVFVLVLSVVLGYMLLNARAVYKLVQYRLNPEGLKNPSELSDIQKVAVNKSPKQSTSTAESTGFDLRENWFSYPELGIKAPIFWDVPISESNTKMNFGLTHIENTSVPGSGGEGLISGHSSHYWWQKGDYSEVFVNLPKAKIGDRFMINKNGLQVYEIDKKYEVKTSQYLEFETEGPERMKLMTCVPIGTNLRRLIIEGKLINVL
ncbi:MAG: sortase [Patescibacteria group bacterium]